MIVFVILEENREPLNLCISKMGNFKLKALDVRI